MTFRHSFMTKIFRTTKKRISSTDFFFMICSKNVSKIFKLCLNTFMRALGVHKHDAMGETIDCTTYGKIPGPNQPATARSQEYFPTVAVN